VSLFSEPENPDQPEDDRQPLAERMRPRGLDELLGQDDLVGDGRPLRNLIESGQLPSMIFWGPPGSGKTTLARIIARETDAVFVPFSAVSSSVSDIRSAVDEARFRRQNKQRDTLLFVDEIHRFNTAQQDAFLPHVEDGTIVLIGATTENPSFEINSPLLSRCRVFTLSRLEEKHLRTIVRRALDHERGYGDRPVDLEEEAEQALIRFSGGDARKALTLLEISVESARHQSENDRIRITRSLLEDAAQEKTFLYDRDGEQHYNLISAFHKSLRGSDPDAALYWMTRMLEGGEDPLYIARRMVRMAVEDTGLADPGALRVALDAKEAYDFLGSPEGELALAQAAIYLALTPKSDTAYAAYSRAKADVQSGDQPPVPLHLRNPVTDLMEEEGYGDEYRNPHREPEAFKEQSYLPEEKVNQTFYHPGSSGKEERLMKRFKQWLRETTDSTSPPD